MADLTPVSGWTEEDARHLGRRAGFGLSPEEAAALAAQPPGTAVDAWVDGTGLDRTLYDDVLATRADPVAEPQRDAATGVAGAVTVPAVPGPHPYLVDGPQAWRNDLARGQASWAFRMQYSPHPFAERMALFWHNLFATGNDKVRNVALMLGQVELFRQRGLDRFEELHVSVSKDPAMCIWLDSVLNNARGSNLPNENYAREALELYSLGADNGYSQADIAELARALSGWSFTVSAAQLVTNPTNQQEIASGGTFRVYDGSANPDECTWNLQSRATLPSMHGSGTASFLGGAFDISAPPAGMAKGEDALRSIVASRGPQCAQFLARRLATHFVTADFGAADLADLAALVQAQSFDLRAVMKALLKSRWFYDPANRFALAEGPVSWLVRAARALGMPLARADAASPKGFPAWALAVSPYLDLAGMKLLDPSGPNGWKEDRAWLNSNTVRYRAKLAAAVALAETATFQGVTHVLFPTAVADWFPAAAATPGEVFDRLAALLQPAPVPAAVRDAWLAGLWPGAFSFDGTSATQDKVRQLAFEMLCSPSAQLY